MPLLVKAMAPKWTLVVVSRVITLAVQTLESVRTRYTICSCLPRRVRLGIGLALTVCGSQLYENHHISDI